MKRIIDWIAIDGMLHLLVCAVLSLAVLCLTDILWLSLVAAAIPAIGKEIWDVFIQKDNNLKQAGHDLICDLAGMFYTTLIYFLETLI